MPRALPAHTPIGPMMNAVSAPTMIMEKNGTNTSCTLSGMILFSPWYTRASTAAMSNGTNTLPL